MESIDNTTLRSNRRVRRTFRTQVHPDGHLLGSLGEAMPVCITDLLLADPSIETHDTWTNDLPR